MHDMNKTYVIINSRKHKQIIVYANHCYRYQSRIKNEKMFWQCAKRGICNARFIINANLEEVIRVEKAGQYEHKATQAEIEVRRKVPGIKRRTEEYPNEPPTSIVRDEVS